VITLYDISWSLNPPLRDLKNFIAINTSMLKHVKLSYFIGKIRALWKILVISDQMFAQKSVQYLYDDFRVL
jgi:hypothetical protein